MSDETTTETQVEIQVTLCTEMNMGDHGERVRTAHLVEPGETVEHLVMRLMKLGAFRPRYQNSRSPSDWIELRYVEGTEPDSGSDFSTFPVADGAPF